MILNLSIYTPWPFPPVWGVADNTKETTKTMGISLRSSSNERSEIPIVFVVSFVLSATPQTGGNGQGIYIDKLLGS